MTIYYNANMILVSNSESDKEFAKYYKLKIMNFDSNNYGDDKNLEVYGDINKPNPSSHLKDD